MGMRNWRLVAGLLLLPGEVLAQTPAQQRCNVDSLYAEQAETRVEWMRRCALLTHVGSPIYGFDTGLPSANGAGNLVDYSEEEPGARLPCSDCYTLPEYNFEVNATQVNLLYLYGGTHQASDADGYSRWWRDISLRRERPRYPMFNSTEDLADSGNRQLFPHPTLADCNLYFDRKGTQPVPLTFFYSTSCESISPRPLTGGLALSPLSDKLGGSRFYSLDIPTGATNLVFETSGGSGNVSLYVRYGSAPTSTEYDCRPFRAGNQELCTMPYPGAGTWHVMLKGYTDYAGVTLKGTWNLLLDGAPSPVMSGAQGSQQAWTMEVPAGKSSVTFTLTGREGATGDADLYVKYGSAPTAGSFDCRSDQVGNTEVCTLSNPGAGTWHVMVYGWSSYSNVSLTGDYN